jgi:hypothetical protein
MSSSSTLVRSSRPMRRLNTRKTSGPVVAWKRGEAQVAEIAARAEKPRPVGQLEAGPLPVVPAVVDDRTVALFGGGSGCLDQPTHGAPPAVCVNDHIGHQPATADADTNRPVALHQDRIDLRRGKNLDALFAQDGAAQRPLNHRTPHGQVPQLRVGRCGRPGQLRADVDLVRAAPEQSFVDGRQCVSQLLPTPRDERVRLQKVGIPERDQSGAASGSPTSNGSRSINVTRWPLPARLSAAVRPAIPAPTTITDLIITESVAGSRPRCHVHAAEATPRRQRSASPCPCRHSREPKRALS